LRELERERYGWHNRINTQILKRMHAKVAEEP
jgi:hypothetical protein